MLQNKSHGGKTSHEEGNKTQWVPKALGHAYASCEHLSTNAFFFDVVVANVRASLVVFRMC